MHDVFESFPQLETRDLLLRRIHISDAKALFTVLSDEAVTEFYDDDAFTNISQAVDQIEAWERGFNNRGCIRWGITNKEDEIIIGSCRRILLLSKCSRNLVSETRGCWQIMKIGVQKDLLIYTFSHY